MEYINIGNIPTIYFVVEVAGVVALAVATAAIYEGGKKIDNQLTHINNNLRGINTSLGKIAEGQLEKEVKQELQQDPKH